MWHFLRCLSAALLQSSHKSSGALLCPVSCWSSWVRTLWWARRPRDRADVRCGSPRRLLGSGRLTTCTHDAVIGVMGVHGCACIPLDGWNVTNWYKLSKTIQQKCSSFDVLSSRWLWWIFIDYLSVQVQINVSTHLYYIYSYIHKNKNMSLLYITCTFFINWHPFIFIFI